MTPTLAQAATAADGDMFLMWGFILAAGAVGLLFLELLVPSGGLIGLLCGVATIGSIVAFFKHSTSFGVASLVLYAILGPVLVVFVFRVWVHSPLARRMVLGGVDEPLPEGEQDALKVSERARMERLDKLRGLIGAEGVTETALRPVGFVKINGQRVDAMAESGVVEAGTPVVVTDVYDNQIKVRIKRD